MTQRTTEVGDNAKDTAQRELPPTMDVAWCSTANVAIHGVCCDTPRHVDVFMKIREQELYGEFDRVEFLSWSYPVDEEWSVVAVGTCDGWATGEEWLFVESDTSLKVIEPPHGAKNLPSDGPRVRRTLQDKLSPSSDEMESYLQTQARNNGTGTESPPVKFHVGDYITTEVIGAGYQCNIAVDFKIQLETAFGETFEELVADTMLAFVEQDERATIDTDYANHLVLVAPLESPESEWEPRYDQQDLKTVSYVEGNGDVHVGNVEWDNVPVGLTVLDRTFDEEVTY